LGEAVTIVAEVVRVNNRPLNGRKGSLLEVVITDGTGTLSLTFFNQAWRANTLRTGARGIFAGKVGEFRGQRQLTHPDYELFDEDDTVSDEVAELWAKTPIPIYPATSTVASWQIAKAIGVVLDTLPELPDPVPDDVRVERSIDSYTDAIRHIHRPTDHDQWRSARETLRFHEAFLVQTALLRDRARAAEAVSMPRTPGELRAQFDAALPYTLTTDQAIVGAEIDDDMARARPMNRLVQGEVGSGKTLVAIRAMLTAIEDGGQAALIAPTEVLATQHARSIVATLGTLADDLNPTLLVGSLPAAQKKRAQLAVASGAARLVIGTHALLADAVTFNELALVVIDEQHRFGVEQRDTLRRKGNSPHVLVLTATPIPRTVAMTVFGDLDISTIRTLPAGRAPIASHVVPLADHPTWVSRVWARLAEEIDLGRQGFVVCSAIDATTTDGDADLVEDAPTSTPRASVTEILPVVRAALPNWRVEMIHGRLSGDEKDAVMTAFSAGQIDVLVATTVIEVGVDVPNASTMVVLDADRFGVSQLHQLRGRVGRGGVPGLALFVTYADENTLARDRVEAVASTLDGFELAQKDLELRHEGDVLGESQSGGRSGLVLVRVTVDGEVIDAARTHAMAVLASDPTLDVHPALKEALERRLSQREREFLGKN
ncbi:MAG: ATP-dependent DNA helicase RecG, partial [Microbacteriaceae bacterium]|nr:ATP-dependent DNA helicase RecG [Microbacteriaceae bacterium]